MEDGERAVKPGRHLYVVEHLDPELEPWQLLEYGTINKECRAANCDFVLAGIGSSSKNQLETMKQSATAPSTEQLLKDRHIDKSRVCLLDPKGGKELSPDDAAAFDVFVFGGILGDDPPRDRTAELRAKGFQGRRLGPEQMTTDTAARVTRIVIEDKVKLDDIPYIDRPDIELGEGESVSMPFKYVRGEDGKPVMPEVSRIVTLVLRRGVY